MELGQNRSWAFSHIKAGYYKKSFVNVSLKAKYNLYTKTIELKAM